jgi:hypothetical protein
MYVLICASSSFYIHLIFSLAYFLARLLRLLIQSLTSSLVSITHDFSHVIRKWVVGFAENVLSQGKAVLQEHEEHFHDGQVQ